MPVQTLFTKEFPPILAGERVGWASVEEMPDTPDVVAINVVVATVSTEGAKHGYHQYDGEDERTYSARSSEGFIAVAGLCVLASREDGIGSGNTYFRAEESKGHSWELLMKGGSGNPGFVPTDEEKTWADNDTELLGLLKEGLAKKDLEDHYSYVYYSLNGMQGHDAYRSRFILRDFSPHDLFLPDGAMTETTKQQLGLANEIVSSLTAVEEEDESMKYRLTVFSDIPATEIPESFVESRRAVATHEMAILAALPKISVPGLVHKPIGFRPNGRSWPYMDAVASTEQQAFGTELIHLEAKQAESVSNELGRELKELEHRLAFARQGIHVLRLLLASEQQAQAA